MGRRTRRRDEHLHARRGRTAMGRSCPLTAAAQGGARIPAVALPPPAAARMPPQRMPRPPTLSLTLPWVPHLHATYFIAVDSVFTVSLVFSCVNYHLVACTGAPLPHSPKRPPMIDDYSRGGAPGRSELTTPVLTRTTSRHASRTSTPGRRRDDDARFKDDRARCSWQGEYTWVGEYTFYTITAQMSSCHISVIIRDCPCDCQFATLNWHRIGLSGLRS